MEHSREHAALVDLISWINEHTSGVTLPADERSMLAAGCFDVAIEHQAAIAVLNSSALYGSMLALLRVLSESLVRGLWLLHCATDAELQKFKRGRIDKTFDDLVTDFEAKIGTPSGVLSGFKATAWKAMNGFTHTGFIQVTRRHSLGQVSANYSEEEIAKALGVAGALGLVAAGQVIGMSDRADLIPKFTERMSSYAKPAPTQGAKA
jgi:hypothetical protein